MRSRSSAWANGVVMGAVAGWVVLGSFAWSAGAPWPWFGTGALLAMAVGAVLWARRSPKEDSAKRSVAPLSSEAQARDFLASVDEMVYFQGLDGSLALLNDANQRITGYSLEEWRANPDLWRDIVHPEDQEVAEAFFAEYPEGTPSFEVDYRLRNKNGEWRWIHSRMVGVRDESGRYIGYNCVDRDVTEKRQIMFELEEHRNHLDELVEQRTRELLEAKQQAERSNRAKTLFLANMSHEVRTPMNAVVGFGDLLARTNLEDKQKSYVDGILNSADSLLTVIDDILDLSRIEAQGLDLDLQDFHLRQTVHKVMSSFDHRSRVSGVSLTHEIEADVPERLNGDPERLSQILRNLINNAVKFTHRGSVTVTVAHLDRREGKDCLRFEVVDTGIGIAPEDGVDIFDAFSQVDTSHTRRYGGTGLGLSIAKELCELMEGEIGFDSRPGDGSTFWFTAWFGRASPSDTVEAPEEAPPPMLDLDVLLVEDNEVNRLVAVSMLESIGCRAESVDNGREALTALESKTFDLVLMDVQMPSMDGFEATREIRRRERAAAEGEAQHLPIIAMTAHAMSGDRARCLAAGMDDYLSKPIRPKELAAVLGRWSREVPTD